MNERELIQYIAGLSHVPDERLLQGIGDDCAVIQGNGTNVWLLTMDTLVEHVHFDLTFHPAYKLGRKVVSVNVSDIGAMGGRPTFALLSVGLPQGYDEVWFHSFSQGITDACYEYGCLLIGGDTVRTPRDFSFTLTLIGEAAADEVVYRRGAQPGDLIWVSGELGLAAAGLALLQQQNPPEQEEQFASLYEKHFNPTARVIFGQSLAQRRLVHAMMDLSDGLATDLAHLCRQSKVGALIPGHSLPRATSLMQAAELIGADPLAWICGGGEDFELLFTSAPEAAGALQELASEHMLELFQVGQIIPGKGVVLETMSSSGERKCDPISYQGYDHFQG